MKRAFTLIEVMIVVAIIAILAGIGVPQYKKYVKKSQLTEASRFMRQIADAEVTHYASHEDTYTTNRKALLVDLPAGKFKYEISVDGANFVDSQNDSGNNYSTSGANCFLIKASISDDGGKTATADDLKAYLIYPTKDATDTRVPTCRGKIESDSGVSLSDSSTNDFWDGNIFTQCFVDSCSGT